MPAAATVLLITLLGAWWIFGRGRFIATAWDALWAGVFTANWSFAIAGTDYFAAGLPVSPLQHFWSLSVEEQFYLVWPWLLIAGFICSARLAPGSAKAQKRWIVAIVGVVVMVSFAASLIETRVSPTWAYFSTYSRAWELGIGALVALAWGAGIVLHRVARAVLLYSGLAGLVASFLVLAPDSSFPAPGALLPTLSTAAVIVAGSNAGTPSARVLTNPVAQYLGKISYSLYLWHFPLIVFAQVFPGANVLRTVLVAIASLGFAVLSFHFVEEPLRRLDLGKTVNRLRKSGRFGEKRASAALAIGLLLCLNVVLYQASSSHLAARSIPVAQQASEPTTATDTASESSDEQVAESAASILREELSEALKADSWESVEPSVDEVLANAEATFTEPEIAECVAHEPYSVEKCTWGNQQGSRTVVLAGNSHSVGMAAPLRAIFEKRPEWRFVVASKTGCPFVDPGGSDADVAVASECADRSSTVVDIANEYSADLLVLVGVDPGAEKKLAELSSATQTVVITPPPYDIDIRECYSGLTGPSACVSTPHEFFGDVERQVSSRAGARLISSESWFCVRGKCPPLAGSLLTKHDNIHVTGSFAARLQPVIEESLIAKGVLDVVGE